MAKAAAGCRSRSHEGFKQVNHLVSRSGNVANAVANAAPEAGRVRVDNSFF